MLSNNYYRRIAIVGGLSVVTIWITYYTLPWIAAVPRKMSPLQNYLIYDESLYNARDSDISQSVWRRPASRAELLLTRDFAVDTSKKTYPRVLQTGIAHKPTPAKPQIDRLKNDTLEDFVVNRGDAYAHPESWEELRRYVEQQKAERTSAFFQSSYARDKPFFGDIPLRICFREYETESGVRTQLQVWRDFKLVSLRLEGGKSPEVFIVAAGGAYNAQVAACEPKRAPAVAYPSEQFWAVVFAGRSGSEPARFILDRATVGRQGARIQVYQPPRGASTADVHEYWFFVPLGRLGEGEYSIEVRSANDDSLIVSTASVLRYATDKEVANRNETNSEQVAASNRHFAGLQQEEADYGAALQLRLERLAEFVASAKVPAEDRQMLAGDVEQLGAAVDWNRDVYSSQRNTRRSLAAPTPGKPVDIGYVNKVLDYPYTPWKKSDLQVSDAWLFAGPEAQWYTSKAYSKYPEFDEAFAAPKPTERQAKIREILQSLAKKSEDGQDKPPLGMIAAGTMEDVIDAAYDVHVNGKDRILKFSSDDDLWAVMVGTRSYFIRQISTREYRDTRDPGPTREFRVHTSAYIGGADRAVEDESSPGTLALIPLGKQTAVCRVAALYSCSSVCCRQVESETGNANLVDATLNDLHFSRYGHGLCYGVYCQVEPANVGTP